jgi:hypothetical protein
MWEGKEEQAAQPVEPEEASASTPAPASAPEENDFNDNDDDFGDDFDDFAEGQEAEDDFGDFDDADETPMAPEPQPEVQTQKPDFLAGLVSSVQSNVYFQQSSIMTNPLLSAIIEFHYIIRYRLVNGALSRPHIPRLKTHTHANSTLRYHRCRFSFRPITLSVATTPPTASNGATKLDSQPYSPPFPRFSRRTRRSRRDPPAFQAKTSRPPQHQPLLHSLAPPQHSYRSPEARLRKQQHYIS